MRYCLICKRCYDDEVTFCESEGAQTATIMAGPRVLDGKYEIERLLGQGGMGAVYIATQHGIERKVAVKLINPSFVANEQALERFKREALASGRVKHPNAITVYDFGVTDEGVAYLAMEFLKGRSLRDELFEVRVLEPRRVVEILVPVCSAIESAHRQNIVHRDLKPDNIFLEELDDGTVTPKVLDFGIAKLRTREAGVPDLTGEGSSIGTPAYMSPEQAKGLHLDARSDVYALGVIAYEMLSGALPFQSVSPMGFLVQHMMEAPIPLSASNPRVSRPLEEAVMRALDKNIDARPATALEFARSIASATTAEDEAGERPTAALGLQETVSFIRKLGAETMASGRATMIERSMMGWPVGIVAGVAPAEASAAFAELARELVAAAAQRVPYDVVYQGSQGWVSRRLGGAQLRPPTSVEPVPGAAPKSAGIGLYCGQEGLAWVARMPSGAELPLLLRAGGDMEPLAETIAGVTQYYCADLPGGQIVALVARNKGRMVWSESVALVDGAVSLVLCVPQPDASATQNPEMFALLFGTMEISCNEAGAEIFVDHGPAPWGVTTDGAPVLLYCMVPGSRHVEIRKEHFVPFLADVAVEPGVRAHVAGGLDRAQARVHIAGNTPGAVVELRGPEPLATETKVTIGSGGVRETLTVAAGTYALSCTHAAHAPWLAQETFKAGAERSIDVTLRPITCPLCGKPASSDTFVCSSCSRPNIHAFHQYAPARCIDCAARSAFDAARTTATVEGWRAYLDAFRSANDQLTRQAELAIRGLVDRAREAELAERAARFAQLAARREIAGVIAQWQRIASEKPADAEARLACGMALEAAGDRNGALGAYRAAVERAPGDPFVRRELARLLGVLRVPHDAVREYTQAVTLKPDFADAHFELASLLAAAGQRDAALEGFRQAAIAKPMSPVYHEGYGRELANHGRFREASEAFRLASTAYRRDGNLQRAIECDRMAEHALGQTTLHKAGRMLKGLFE